MRFFQMLLRAWQDLLRTPASSLANILVIGIALAIPTVGYGLAMSTTKLSFALEHRPHINVFIANSASENDVAAITEELEFTEGINDIQTISKEDALTAFEKSTGIENILESLSKNPLPTTLVITPDDDFLESLKLEQLIDNINKIDGIDEVQINQEWLQRLNVITEFIMTIVYVLAGLIACAIIFILSNTIRLLIANRRNEIVVSKLVGASDSYVRQPFLYLGFLYGLLGGLLAFGIYWLVIFILQTPINEFASSYGTNFLLHELDDKESAALIIGAAVLGWLAARFSVNKHLNKIKPR